MTPMQIIAKKLKSKNINIETARNLADKMIVFEKEMIMDAYIDASKREHTNSLQCYPTQSIVMEAEGYYNQISNNE